MTGLEVDILAFVLLGLGLITVALLRIRRDERREQAWRAQVNDAIAVVQAWRAEMEDPDPEGYTDWLERTYRWEDAQ